MLKVDLVENLPSESAPLKKESISKRRNSFFCFSDPRETFSLYTTMVYFKLDPIFIQDCIQYCLLIRPKQIENLISMLTLNAIENGCNDTTNKYIRKILLTLGLISGDLPTIKYTEIINHFPIDTIEYCIIKDNEIDFETKIKESGFDPNKKIQIDEDSPMYFVKGDKSVTYMQLIVFYASVNCFKLALKEKMFDTKDIEKYAIAGGSTEIIEIMRDEGFDFSNCFEVAVKYHRNDIFEWLHSNYKCEPISSGKAIDYFNVDAYDFIIKNNLSPKEEDTKKKSMLEKVRTISQKIEVDPKYDDKQTKIILLNKGTNIVLAGPGCGKTDILAERVSNAINRGVSVDDMLCLTFTNRAAREMKKRISQKVPNINDLFIGNIHNFCQRYAEKDLIDNIKSNQIIYKYVKEEYGTISNEWDKRTTINKVYNYQHKIYRIEKGIFNEEKVDEPEEKIKNAATKYKVFKESHGLIDFEDLLLTTYEYAKNNQSTIKKYKWIQIDEVQDLTPLMHSIIELFIDENATVLYLGDGKQTIFSFMGANLESFQKFKNDKNIIELENNYRSPQYLLDVFNAYSKDFLECSMNLKCKGPKFENCRHSYITSSSNVFSYLNVILSQLNEFKTKNPNDRTAILTRLNSDSSEIAKYLKFKNIKYFNIAEDDVFKKGETLLLLSHLSILTDDTNFGAWIDILNKIINSSEPDSYTLMNNFKSNYICPTDFFLYDDSSYLLETEKVYNQEYIIFDTETTGLDVFSDDIVQIAALKCKGSEIIAKFNVIMETDKEIPAKLGSIKNPLVKKYAEQKTHNRLIGRKEGLLKFLDFAKGIPLIGHNSENYDSIILDSNLKKYCQVSDFKKQFPLCFDTLKLSRIIEPSLKSHKLKYLLEKLGLNGVNSHLADDDVVGTKCLLEYCMEQFARQKEKHKKSLKENDLIRKRLKQCYAPLYIEAKNNLFNENKEGSILVEFMKKANNHFIKNNMSVKNDRLELVFKYIENDVIDNEKYPRLFEQLMKYTHELKMLCEADFYGSSVIEEKVFITTIHKAKGLEFENVIIYNFFGKTTNKGLDEETNRLCYVAMTRAIKRLVFLFKNDPKNQFKDIFTDFFKKLKESKSAKI